MPATMAQVVSMSPPAWAVSQTAAWKSRRWVAAAQMVKGNGVLGTDLTSVAELVGDGPGVAEGQQPPGLKQPIVNASRRHVPDDRVDQWAG